LQPPDWIRIPAIGLDAPVVPAGWETIELDGAAYGRWQTPNWFAAGWHDSSAGVGQVGNLVLNGHHNVYGAVFGGLIYVEPGDTIELDSGTETFTYVVVQTMVLPERDRPVEVRLENARWVLPTTDERVTLVTCWPSDGNSHRLIVVARPFDAVRSE
jgi:sortase A